MISSPDDSLPGQGEIGTSISEIEKIGERVLLSLKEHPPTEKAEEVDSFWSNPTVFTDPRGVFGEVIKMMWATDQNWSRRGFKRMIYNEAGEEIGEWNKTGFFRYNEEIKEYAKASFFEEDLILKPEKRHEKMTVGIRKNGEVYLVKREISNYDPQGTGRHIFDCIEDQELHYRYDEEGNLLEIELYDLEPIKDIDEAQKRIRNQRVVFVSNIAIKNRDERRRAIFRAEYAASHPPKPALTSEPKKRKWGIFQRFIPRK